MSEAYYKATRRDGTDFWSGRVDYGAARGDIVQHPFSKTMEANDAGTYLSISTEPADCTGFRWPARLFRVEPVGNVLDGLEYQNKRACLALRVIEELPEWQVFGPNGREVVAFVEHAAVVAAYAEANAPLTSALAATGERRLRNAVSTAKYAAMDHGRYAAWEAAVPPQALGARAGAYPPALLLARALVVQDLIDSATFDTLVTPWRDRGKSGVKGVDAEPAT